MTDPYRQPDPCGCNRIECVPCMRRLDRWLPRFNVPRNAMTKPHEETWSVVEVTHDQTEIEVADTEERIAITFFEPTRARLAAQAPAMARLLLELQWLYSDREARPICPSCASLDREGHSEDCKLATVLRAAGVLP